MDMEITCQDCACMHSHRRNHENHENRRNHAHAHAHAHAHSAQPVARSLILSAVLLVSGMLLQHMGTTFFRPGFVQLIWFAAAYLPVGWAVVREALKNLARKDFFNEFSLMTLASIGAFCIGEYPEGVAVMLFYSVGERMQHRAVDRATRNIRRLLDVRPEQVNVWREGAYQTVSPHAVRPGETIEVKPGERVPLDGILLSSIPVQDAPLNEGPLDDTPLKDTLLKDTLLKEALLKDTLLKETPLKDTLLKDSLLKEAPLKEALLKDSLLKETPLKDSPLKEAPLSPIPKNDLSLKEVLRNHIPLHDVSQKSQAVFDTSALTGESMPRTVTEGDEVLAGMIADGQAVRIQTTRPYDQSTLARILSLVEEAAERKAPAELFIRRFARMYTPVVTLSAFLIVALPALTAVLSPSFQYVFGDWLYRGLVFLVISCPCALVISIPLGYFGGIGAASRAGILFKGSNYLDAITRIRSVVFDKTGTLTTGRFEVSAVHPEGVPTGEWLGLLLSAEQKSTHPVAQAIVRYARQAGVRASENVRVSERAGYGLQAQVDGREILLGPARLLAERNIPIPPGLSEAVCTQVVCAIGGRYAGYLSLCDALKEDAPEAIRRLKTLSIPRIQLLSGDKKEIVRIFARKLGIEQAYADLLPADKTAHLKRLQRETGAPVAFVGDGMNDAPALALSDVGIAMGGLGSDAAIESADVVIQTDQPSKVATAIGIGRATRRIVTQNIVGAIGVKAVILLAGACGYVTLWAAVFADVGVALLAVLNSVRILYKHFK